MSQVPPIHIDLSNEDRPVHPEFADLIKRRESFGAINLPPGYAANDFAVLGFYAGKQHFEYNMGRGGQPFLLQHFN